MARDFKRWNPWTFGYKAEIQWQGGITDESCRGTGPERKGEGQTECTGHASVSHLDTPRSVFCQSPRPLPSQSG